LWVYGFENGKLTYYSLKLRDLGKAQKKLSEIIANSEKPAQPSKPTQKTVAEAIKAFLDHKNNRSSETLRKYRRNLKTFQT